MLGKPADRNAHTPRTARLMSDLRSARAKQRWAGGIALGLALFSGGSAVHTYRQ